MKHKGLGSALGVCHPHPAVAGLGFSSSLSMVAMVALGSVPPEEDVTGPGDTQGGQQCDS